MLQTQRKVLVQQKLVASLQQMRKTRQIAEAEVQEHLLQTRRLQEVRLQTRKVQLRQTKLVQPTIQNSFVL